MKSIKWKSKYRCQKHSVTFSYCIFEMLIATNNSNNNNEKKNDKNESLNSKSIQKQKLLFNCPSRYESIHRWSSLVLSLPLTFVISRNSVVIRDDLFTYHKAVIFICLLLLFLVFFSSLSTICFLFFE